MLFHSLHRWVTYKLLGQVTEVPRFITWYAAHEGMLTKLCNRISLLSRANGLSWENGCQPLVLRHLQFDSAMLIAPFSACRLIGFEGYYLLASY
jgi:hypothetical protein